MRYSNLIKALSLVAVIGFGATSCSDKKEAKQDNSEALTQASRQELEAAVNDRDELLSLVSEISDGLSEIKSLETIMANDQSETPSQKAQIRSDIEAIRTALADRRKRLEELEGKLANSNLYTEKLKQTIASMKAQIEEQDAEIQRLTGELSAAKEHIAVLDTRVDSLNTTVTNVTTERDAAEAKATETANELNKCYYAVGSKKELKEHKILESGFLRKTKILKGEFDQTFFTVGDKRTLTTIPLYAKKAKVITGQPAESYQIVDNGGSKVLKITNPAKFWGLSNYLVIELD